jgi:hypothetical protein
VLVSQISVVPSSRYICIVFRLHWRERGGTPGEAARGRKWAARRARRRMLSPPSLPPAVRARSLAGPHATESALPPTAVWSAVRTGRYAWYEVQLQRAYAS